MERQDKRPETIAALAGARAIPPLLIVLYHFSEGHHYTGVHALNLVIARGYLWVEFFFALSGFVLTHAYGARAAQLRTKTGFLDFLRARLTRLYPLHLFMLLALVGLMVAVRAAAALGGYASIYDSLYHPMIPIKGFILSLLLLHGWDTLPYLVWNGASWFVSVEFALCLLFPLILWLAQGTAWRGFALIAAGIAGMLGLLAISTSGLDLTFHLGVPRGLASFAVGAGMAVLYRETRVRAAAAPDWVFSAGQLALLALLAWVCLNTGWSQSGRDIYTVLPLLALILALAFDRGVLAELLKARPLQKLGEWSYAIYMGQTFWLQYMRVLESRLYPAPDTLVLGMRFSTLIWWLEPVLLLLVCLLWGGALAEWVEKPANAWLKGRLDRRPAAAPSSGVT